MLQLTNTTRLALILALSVLAACGGGDDDATTSAPVAQAAETTDAITDAEAPVVEPAPGVGLDRLLQLPSSMSFDTQERSGEGAAAWRQRFRERHQAVEDARAEVARIKLELDEAAGGGAGGQWQIAPPGANNTETTPVSFKLREELRVSRVELESAERSLRELEIEADLASVPPEWRH